MAWTFCTSGAAVGMAGAGADTNATTSGALMTWWSNQVEGRIQAETKKLWLDNYSSLASGAKLILQDAAAAGIAMHIVNYNTSGYTDRREAETTLDFLDDTYNDGIKVLKDWNGEQNP